MDEEEEEVEEEEEAGVEVSMVDLYLAAMPHLPNLATAPQFPYKFLRIFCMGAHTGSTNVSYPRMPTLQPSPVFEPPSAAETPSLIHLPAARVLPRKGSLTSIRSEQASLREEREENLKVEEAEVKVVQH